MAHKIDFRPYKDAGARMARILQLAAEEIAANNANAALKPDVRAHRNNEALQLAGSGLAALRRKAAEQYESDRSAADVLDLPEVHAGNVALRSYWQAKAAEIFQGVSPAAVAPRLRRALLADPSDAAREELVAAARAAHAGAGLEDDGSFAAVLKEFATPAEVDRLDTKKAIDGIGFRFGLIEQHLNRSLDELRQLASPAAVRQIDTPGGRAVLDSPPPLPVFDSELPVKWANCLEEAAKVVDAGGNPNGSLFPPTDEALFSGKGEHVPNGQVYGAGDVPGALAEASAV